MDKLKRLKMSHDSLCRMSTIGSWADNTAIEDFFDLLKREAGEPSPVSLDLRDDCSAFAWEDLGEQLST